MAKVIWRKKAMSLLEAHPDYALTEFGIMKNFKLVHYYDSSNDTVYIDYIWDMRKNPARLKRMKFN